MHRLPNRLRRGLRAKVELERSSGLREGQAWLHFVVRLADVPVKKKPIISRCRDRLAVPIDGIRFRVSAGGCQTQSNDGNIASMSTVEAIEQAIEGLTAAEREALESRLLTRRFGLDSLNNQERTELLRSLDQAERDIDEGRSHTADELRKAVRSWTGE
jgi:hypothetical protein